METKHAKRRQSRPEKTVMIRLRVESQRKKEVEEILDALGLTPTQVVNVLFAQIVARKEVPFRIGLPAPNKKTIDSMEAGRRGEVKSFSTVRDLMVDLNEED